MVGAGLTLSVDTFLWYKYNHTMLRMRLQRFGRKHDPYYRVVIAEKDAPVKGKFITSIGQYNPAQQLVNINKDQVLEWLGKGVQPSNRVSRLLTNLGVKHKLVVVKQFRAKSKAELQQEEKQKEAEKVKEEAQKAEAAKEAEIKQAAIDEKKKEETPEQPKEEKAETK